MPAIADISTQDRATTPASHVFKPFEKGENGVFSFRDSGSTPVADKVYTISYRKTAGGKYQAKLKLAVPVVQNSIVNGVTIPVVVRTGYVDTTITFDPTSTEQERKDAISMFFYSINPDWNGWLVDGVITSNGGMY